MVQQTPSHSIKKPTCDVLVLNYNGLGLLQSCLPSVVEAAKRSRLSETSVILIDNGSHDDSVQWAKAALPSVKSVGAPGNDYLYSLNWAAEQSSAEYLLILNNDVRLEVNSIDPLIEPLLHDPEVFSVSAKLLTFDGSGYDAGKRWGEFRRGFLHHSHDVTIDHLSPTLFPTGASFVVRRDNFLRIGGFQRLYFPGYWEDAELGYRSWKFGWKNLWTPHSVMYHMGSASFNRLGTDYKQVLNWRNAWLFTWRMVTDKAILGQNLYWTARYYLHSIRTGEQIVPTAVRDALKKWQEAVSGRGEVKRSSLLRDDEVLARANAEYP